MDVLIGQMLALMVIAIFVAIVARRLSLASAHRPDLTMRAHALV